MKAANRSSFSQYAKLPALFTLQKADKKIFGSDYSVLWELVALQWEKCQHGSP